MQNTHEKNGTKIARTGSDILISLISYGVVIAFSITVLYPVLNIIAVSMSSYNTFSRNPMMIFPTELDFKAYQAAFASRLLMGSYLNTINITLFGTILTLIITILTAYPLSRPQLRLKPLFNTLLIITMMFSGGIIPAFLLIRTLGLIDKLPSLYLPSILSAFNVILMTNFFKALPDSLIEAAMVDGANEPFILSRIVVPLSMPVIATITLFAAVGFWNNYFSAVLYIRRQENWPLQLVLREIITAANTAALAAGGNLAEINTTQIPMDQLRYASLIVVMLPIMCIYPFLQRYFASGVMLGAVKG